MFDFVLKYILWYEFLNDLDAQSDFDKKIVTKKVVKWNYSYLKYALEGNQNKNNSLVINFYNKQQIEIFRAFLSPCLHRVKCGKFQFLVEIAHKAIDLVLISL